MATLAVSRMHYLVTKRQRVSAGRGHAAEVFCICEDTSFQMLQLHLLWQLD
jgi:hypothetical protein